MTDWTPARARRVLAEIFEAPDPTDVEAHDAAANDSALDDGSRVFSAYETEAGRIWVITESDRSSTCVLRPDEY